MSKKTLVFLGILGLLIIFLLCAMTHWRAIEKDVANCANKILSDAKLNRVKVDTQDLGRSAHVSGIVSSKKAKQRVMALLKNQCNMTGISENIKIIIPKPSIISSLKFSINKKNKSVDIKGNIASVREVNGIIDNFKSTLKGMKISHSLQANKKVFPSKYLSFTKAILPKLFRVKNAEIEFVENQITLKGIVANQNIKQQISKQLNRQLNKLQKNNAIVTNLMTIAAKPKIVIDKHPSTLNIKPLNAVSCQNELSKLLSSSMVHFNTGSADIKEDSTKLLNNLAHTAKSCQKVMIQIIGHTDKTGNETNNVNLSLARASSVLGYLTNAGVQSKKLSANGLGSSEPLATNKTPEGRSQNRRIEFKVHSL